MRLWAAARRRLRYLRGIYARLNITLTDADMAPESFYNSMLGDVCDELESKGIAVMSGRRAVRVPARIHPAGTASRY